MGLELILLPNVNLPVHQDALRILVWLNRPEAARIAWAGSSWSEFCVQCRSRFAFDPEAGGFEVASKNLSRGRGAWSKVWETYVATYTQFPGVAVALTRANAPKRSTASGALADWEIWGSDSGKNEQAEAEVRAGLLACGDMTSEKAARTVQKLERAHGCRRMGVWSRLKKSSLADALLPLSKLSRYTKMLPMGSVC